MRARLDLQQYSRAFVISLALNATLRAVVLLRGDCFI